MGWVVKSIWIAYILQWWYLKTPLEHMRTWVWRWCNCNFVAYCAYILVDCLKDATAFQRLYHVAVFEGPAVSLSAVFWLPVASPPPVLRILILPFCCSLGFPLIFRLNQVCGSSRSPLDSESVKSGCNGTNVRRVGGWGEVLLRRLGPVRGRLSVLLHLRGRESLSKLEGMEEAICWTQLPNCQD